MHSLQYYLYYWYFYLFSGTKLLQSTPLMKSNSYINKLDLTRLTSISANTNFIVGHAKLVWVVIHSTAKNVHVASIYSIITVDGWIIVSELLIMFNLYFYWAFLWLKRGSELEFKALFLLWIWSGLAMGIKLMIGS